MTWFPANIQKGSRMSDRVRAAKPVHFYQDGNNKGKLWNERNCRLLMVIITGLCVSSLWPSRRSWCCSSCCCCLSWPVMLTACLTAANNRLAPVDSTCCCAAPAASPRGGRWPGMQPQASSLWASAKKTRNAFRADSTCFSTDPGTRRPGSWRWARGLRRQLGSSWWTGRPAQRPCPFNSCWWSRLHWTAIVLVPSMDNYSFIAVFFATLAFKLWNSVTTALEKKNTKPGMFLMLQ